MAQVNPILERALQAELERETGVPSEESASKSRLLAVESALSEATEQSQESKKQVEGLISSSSAATKAIVETLAQNTVADQTIAKTRLNADMQAQNANIDILEAFGGTEAQVTIASDLRDVNQRLEDLRDEKSTRMSEEHTGLGPVDTIINLLSTIDTDAQIRATVQERDDTTARIQNITASQESFAKANSLTRKTINEGVIQANLNKIAGSNKILAEEAKIRNLHSNADLITKLGSANDKVVANMLSFYRLEGEEQNREIRQIEAQTQVERLEFQRKSLPVQLETARKNLEAMELNIEQLRLTNPAKAAALIAQSKDVVEEARSLESTRRDMGVAVQRAQSGMGLPLEPLDVINRKLEDPTTKQRYTKLQELGITDDPLGFTMGTSFSDAMNTRRVVAPDGRMKPTAATRLADIIENQQANAYAQSRTPIPKDQAVLDAALDARAAVVMEATEANIQGPDNPLHSPPMETLTEFMPSITETALYQKVLKAKSLTEVNHRTIMDATTDSILAGVVTPEEASDGMETIFRAAAFYNNSIEGGFRRVGLDNQTTYNVQFERPDTKLDRAFALLPSPSEVFTETLPKALSFVPTAEEPLAPATRVVEAIGEVRGIFQSPLITVDMMDGARIKEYIAKVLAVSPPITPVTPTAKQEEEQ